jgi:hypothetical protein
MRSILFPSFSSCIELTRFLSPVITSLKPHSSGVGRGHGLNDLGDLGARADNALASRVVHVGDVLVLELGALPDLDLAAAAEDADAHGGEQVVGGVGVQVDAAVEDGGGVLADGRGDEGLAAGVVLDEVGHVVDDAGDGDEGLAVLGVLDEVVPADDGELLEGRAPVELGALLVELLLHLLDAALLDLVGAELLEVVGETEVLPEGDGPLGRVVLVPFDGVAVVRGELVVEVVVALAEGDERGDDVVAGRVAVVKGLLAEPVGERVDAEGGLLDEADAQDAGVDVAAEPVTPEEAADERREDEAHGHDALDEVAVLPDDDGVLVEVGDVGAAGALGVLLEDHPAEVGVEETLADRVGVLDGVGVSVVGAVIPGPPPDGALHGAGAHGSKVDLKRRGGLVRAVSPETVVAYKSKW